MIFNSKAHGNKIQIMAIMYWNGLRKKKYTGISLNPDQWDKKRKRVKKHPMMNEYNELLSKYESRFQEYLLFCKNTSRTPDLEYAYHLLDKNNSPLYGRRLVTDAIKFYIDKNRLRLNTTSVNKYTAVMDDVVRFNPEATISDVCGSWYGRFAEFLLGSGNQNSTINRKITSIRTCMTAVVREEWIDTQRHLQDFNLDEVASNRVPLNKNERVALLNYHTNNLLKKTVVEAFCFSMYTGLRYSDLRKVGGHNIITYMSNGDSVKCVEMVMTKTKKKITVPIPSHVQKYIKPGLMFAMGENSQSNEVIKEICKEIGLDRLVECKYAKGAVVETKMRPLYEIVSFHFARYTYTSILDETGMSSFMMMEALGHTSVGVTEGYRRENERLRIEETLKKVGI